MLSWLDMKIFIIGKFFKLSFIYGPTYAWKMVIATKRLVAEVEKQYPECDDSKVFLKVRDKYLWYLFECKRAPTNAELSNIVRTIMLQ